MLTLKRCLGGSCADVPRRTLRRFAPTILEFVDCLLGMYFWVIGILAGPDGRETALHAWPVCPEGSRRTSGPGHHRWLVAVP